MRIPFTFPYDSKLHQYCVNCHFDGVTVVWQDSQKCFSCPNCHQVNVRNIMLGNGVGANWWIDDKTEELWHESAGVFICNPEGKYLFFERTDFPKGYTIPAGHVDFGEDHRVTAVRETEEEVGVHAQALTHVVDADIAGDSCISGADIHRWHVYREDLSESIEVTVLEEGRRPVWLTLEEASAKDVPFAIRYILDNYTKEVDAAKYLL